MANTSIPKKIGKDQELHDAAIKYAELGYYIVPLRPNEKILTPDGPSYVDASKSVRQVSEWFSATGKHKGCNIGLATGKEDGIFVVDVDRHGDVDGYKSMTNLIQHNGALPDGPVQTTPNNGVHYIFKWEPNATNSTSKIAMGIDTRGGTEEDCKGHVVAWPSTTKDGKYQWGIGAGKVTDLPFAPKWIMDRMGHSWASKAAKDVAIGRGSENVGEDKEVQLSRQQMEEMLSHIPINHTTYDDWLQLGQAINSQFPDEEGLDIWDQWSEQGDRYEPNECRKRWRGFEPDGLVRVGTIFFHANAAGWQPKKEDKVAATEDLLIETMNRKYAVIVVGGKTKILQTGLSVLDPHLDNPYSILDKEGFKTLLDNQAVWRDNKPVKISAVWLAHGNRRTYGLGMGLYPDGKCPEGKYNTWNGFAIKPVKGKCSEFLAHIMNVICKGHEDQYNWLLDWCADAVQYPGSPKGCAVVMRGREGTGKGTLANVMLDIFGVHSRHLIDDSHLVSNFNSHMIDAIMIFADEITWGGNIKTAGKLKGIVTEEHLIGERKGVDAVSYKNMCHLIVASNEDWVIPAGSHSRRWFMLNVSNEQAKDKSYFNMINHELDNGGREAFMHTLTTRKITANLRTAMETTGLMEQREHNTFQDTANEWWVEVLISARLAVTDIGIMDPADPSEWPKKVSLIELYSHYKEWAIIRKSGRSTRPLIYWRRKVVQDFGLAVRGDDIVIPTLDECKVMIERNLNIKL